MIQGIGVDIVLIKRFESWLLFSERRLSRIFHPVEIEEFSKKLDSDKATFLASRFAVKEAFFKACSSFLVQQKKTEKMLPFLALARSIYVAKMDHGVPELRCALNIIDQELVFHLSLSHEKDHVIAFVVIEQ